MNNLGERLAKKRREKGWNQEDLADYAGLSGKTVISRYEKNIGRPSIENIKKLAEVLGCSSRWLEFGDEPKSEYEEWKDEKIRLLEENLALFRKIDRLQGNNTNVLVK